MESKEIRFIDSHYNELFRIKDGESITVTFQDGSKSDRECKYIDDYHAKIGYNVYHIAEQIFQGLYITHLQYPQGILFLFLRYNGRHTCKRSHPHIHSCKHIGKKVLRHSLNLYRIFHDNGHTGKHHKLYENRFIF